MQSGKHGARDNSVTNIQLLYARNCGDLLNIVVMQAVAGIDL